MKFFRKRDSSSKYTRRTLAGAFSTLALVAFAMLMASPARADGSINEPDSTLSTVYSKNVFVYGAAMTAPTSYSGTITGVSYSLSPGSYPIGHAEALCDITNNMCVNITGTTSGSTSGFNGRPISDTLKFRFTVSGSGTMSPWNISGKVTNVFYVGTP